MSISGYALFFPADGYCPERVLSAVVRQGFVKAPESPEDAPLYLGRYACAACISAESGNDVKRTIFQQSARSGCDLQGASGIADGDDALLSGQLVLSMSASVIYHPSGGTDHGVKWCAA